MKAMILAAGEGSRMRPLTHSTPKPLLPIQNTPLIVHHIRHLAQAGIVDIVINIFHLADKITQTLGDGNALGVNITYSDERPYGQRLDTAGGIRLALPLLGDTPFLLLSADIFTDFPYDKILKMPSPSHAHLVLVSNPDFHPKGDFDLDDQHRITQGPITPYTYANIGLFHPDLFASLPIAPLPLSKILTPHINNRHITGEPFQGQWDNIGTPKQLASYQDIPVR
jgi:N-acetyl-alpha-D-muramate 1-phosphate uridylyltransferase